MKPDNVRSAPARRQKDAEGRTICSCGCGRHPPKGRRTWFSQECVDKWMLANHAGTIRQAVYKRDRGICAECGRDASKAFKAWQAARGEARRLFDWFWKRHLQDIGSPYRYSTAADREPFMERLVPTDGWSAHRSTGWDADHIIPVVRGGANLGLENLRTLCHRCHKAATARLAAERAAEKTGHRDRQMVLGLDE